MHRIERFESQVKAAGTCYDTNAGSDNIFEFNPDATEFHPEGRWPICLAHAVGIAPAENNLEDAAARADVVALANGWGVHEQDAHAHEDGGDDRVLGDRLGAESPLPAEQKPGGRDRPRDDQPSVVSLAFSGNAVALRKGPPRP